MAPTDTADRQIVARVFVAVVGVTGLIALALFARHAIGYFFLFDDFALVNEAASNPAVRILAQPLIGFYRPLPFLLLRAETLLFAWDTPSAYAAVSLMLHVANAILCSLLARTFRLPSLAAMLTGVLFLLSPWATEAFLWLSGRFDVMSTGGVLIALFGVRLTVVADTRVRVMPILLTAIGAAIALLSKEQAATLPVLAILVVIADRPIRTLAHPPIVAAIAAPVLLLLMYLAMRAQVIGMLQGAYGSFGSLLAAAHVVQNVRSYVCAFALLPVRLAVLPQDFSLSVLLRDAFLAMTVPIGLWALISHHPRMALICTAAFLAAVAPVSWFGMSSPSTLGGRFLYAPAWWLVLALAIGLADGIETLPAILRLPAPPIASLLLSITCGYLSASLWYQVDLWQFACRLSRATFDQVAPYRGRTGMVLEIENMPYQTTEGPYVLKAYAFRLYRPRHAAPLPPVVAYISLRKQAWNGQAVSTLGIDPSSEYPAGAPPGTTATRIRLALP